MRIAQINLAYTEIHAPVSGKISRTNITVGNVVSPSSGPLATIVSQDPMYVLFPIAVRAEIDLEKRYADQGGMSAVVIRLRLPDGTMYGQSGKIDYIEPSVQATTDTILMRGKIANPPLKPIETGKPVDRPLIDGEFVTVLVEGIAAGGSIGDTARRDTVGPTGRLRLCRRQPKSRRAATHPARPIDAVDRGHHDRPQGRRNGRARGHPARAARHPGDPWSRRAHADRAEIGRSIAA